MARWGGGVGTMGKDSVLWKGVLVAPERVVRRWGRKVILLDTLQDATIETKSTFCILISDM